MHLEEVDIEDARNINFNWLIDMKELEIKGKDDRSVVIGGISIAFFRSKSGFLIN